MRDASTYRAVTRNAVKAARQLSIWRERAAAEANGKRFNKAPFLPVFLPRITKRHVLREAKARAYRAIALAGGGKREVARRFWQVKFLEFAA